MIRLAVDFECPTQEWWDQGGRDLWDGLLEGFEESEVVLDDAVAESVLAQCASIPGWDAGPEWAPHPIRVKPIDEDEEV